MLSSNHCSWSSVSIIPLRLHLSRSPRTSLLPNPVVTFHFLSYLPAVRNTADHSLLEMFSFPWFSVTPKLPGLCPPIYRGCTFSVSFAGFNFSILLLDTGIYQSLLSFFIHNTFSLGVASASCKAIYMLLTPKIYIFKPVPKNLRFT